MRTIPAKRIFDLLVTVLLLPFAIPLVVALAALIRIFDGSPVLFSQERIGYLDCRFRLFKFRTMSNATNPAGELLPDADRLSRLGGLIRASSLDELPQFWNVLRGEMSLCRTSPASCSLSAPVFHAAKASPSCKTRHYRMGSDKRSQYVDMETKARVRPMVCRTTKLLAGSEDPDVDRSQSDSAGRNQSERACDDV